ncbi:MAG: hypothetical protein HEEMFOPI_00745 [Holosporales bacterium]
MKNILFKRYIGALLAVNLLSVLPQTETLASSAAHQNQRNQKKQSSNEGNAYYNNNLPLSDKAIIDLFAQQTGLDKRSQSAWEKLPAQTICSPSACPQDRQIKCYRGVPESVDGCQDQQRERLSNFVKSKIMMTPNSWSNNGIPGSMTRAEYKKPAIADNPQKQTTTYQAPQGNKPGLKKPSTSGNLGTQQQALQSLGTPSTEQQTSNLAPVAIGAGLAGVSALNTQNSSTSQYTQNQSGQSPQRNSAGQFTQENSGDQAEDILNSIHSSKGIKCSENDIRKYGQDLRNNYLKLKTLSKMKHSEKMSLNISLANHFGRSVIDRLSIIACLENVKEQKELLYIMLKADLGLFEKTISSFFPKDSIKGLKNLCTCALKKTNNDNITSMINIFIQGISNSG